MAMNKINLVLLWHMHQPQYRDPESGRYVLPWTRLHALKDYWGMVKILEGFPEFHATFNVVPSLGLQLEEYASGKFNEPWFELAFKNAEQLTREDKTEILSRAFQVNHERLLSRWPRFQELFEWSRPAGGVQAIVTFTPRDWRDLQLLSQLAWMEEEWIARDPEVNRLSGRGKNFSEADKAALKTKQLEFLKLVLPIYKEAAARGQIELSTTPFYHPILPLVCDSDIARVANPGTPLPRRAYKHPEDAREQLRRAREYHERVFGVAPAGLWPSEGSVSDQTLTIAAEEGFKWFGTDEGVLGRTLNIGFFRDGSGLPANSERLYKPWKINMGEHSIIGFFRDHHISDLIGFVYSRMDGKAAAADLHGRLRSLGERVPASNNNPLTISLFLDGENAWEYYPGNGREFLREFYGRIQSDNDFRALTVSEAIQAGGELPQNNGIFPASWISANFDVWIGNSEDVAAWELLWDARETFARAEAAHKAGKPGSPSAESLAKAKESLLAAEGSDWCWWYGPEHSTANDAEFDALYRKHLTGIYVALGEIAPDELANPIKKLPERALHLAPTEFVKIKVDGRESTYFEWMGAGLYAPERRSGAMHGRSYYLKELRYGFETDRFCLRLDCFEESLRELEKAEFRVTIQAADEIVLIARLGKGKLTEFSMEQARICLLNPLQSAEVAFEKILEVALKKELLLLRGIQKLRIGVALWHGGLPVDVLPAEGYLDVPLGDESAMWAIEPAI